MLGAGRIKFGRRIAGFEQKGSTVTARFADRDGAIVETTEADILIGADGIHSAVRAHFHPDEGPPKWQGILMWRGVTVGKPYLGGNTMVQAGHHNQKFVCYPISRAHAERGEALINWICDLHMGDDAMLPREDWNRPGKLADFLPRFEDWNFGWLDVPGVIRSAHAIFEFPMVDRDPLPGWSHGRITLLGDAAHPMYPIGSNGASQAILDGEAITQELLAGGDPEAALLRYERAACRRPRASSKAIAARASTSCSTSSSSARRRALPISKACCRAMSWNGSSATTRSSRPRTARRC